MSFIPRRIPCGCSGFLHESFICLCLFLFVVMRHTYLGLAGWRAWVSSLSRHAKKWYVCQVITLGLSLEIPLQLFNRHKNLASDSQGFFWGLLPLEPYEATAAFVIINLLFSFVSLHVHVFILFHKLFWLARETEEKRGNYSFPQPRQGTEVDGCFCKGVHRVQGQLFDINTLSENRTPACFKVISVKCFFPPIL